MKSVLLIAALLVAGALAKDGKVCEPGANFKVDCNTCRCSADGLLMSCTRKFCVHEEQSDDPKVQTSDEPSSVSNAVEEEQVQTNGQVCTPNEVKMEDCNRCKCAANGIGWFCTRRACPQREKRDVSSQSPAAQQCVPGTTFKSSDGCNNCFCTETGIAACTLRACLKFKREVADNRKNNPECVPGTSFKSPDGCNDCFCSESGHAACTLRFCFGPQQGKLRKRSPDAEPLPKSKIAPGTEGFSCTPGTSFKFECNTCRCDTTGKSAACTYKFCLPNEGDES